MKQKINLHTHCNFCDGDNTPEEMIIAAIQKGFTVLGFSSHSLFPFSKSDWHIPSNKFNEYSTEIRRLAEKYSSQIKILLGFEADYLKGVSVPSYENYAELNPDYLIGSIHYVFNKKGMYSVDNKTEKVQQSLKKMYTNKKGEIDGKKAVCEYFATQREMLKKGTFQILGHPDVIRKRNSVLNFFDPSENWYKKELIATAKEIKKADVIVEINTGAISRGIFNSNTDDDFYPSKQFLEIIHKMNIPVLVSSDAHKTDDLDCGFERGYDFAKKIGYKELTYPVANKIISIPLE